MTTADDLRAAVETAFVHCRPGGAALFVVDVFRETFKEGTDHGGHADGQRGLRFLEWSWDPDPSDTSFNVDFAYLLRDTSGGMRVVHDRHIFGLFSRDDWRRVLGETGFVVRQVEFAFAPTGGGFLGLRPGAG